MSDPTTCPTCGNRVNPDPGLELGHIAITRRLTEAGRVEVGVIGSEAITFYDAMAMIHIAADTIAQGALTGGDDD